MKSKIVQLSIAASILIIPFIARADPMIDDDISKGVVQFFNTKACAKVCLKEISGTTIEIRRVDINFDKKAEYLVSLPFSPTDCGSAGCPAALFMYREGAWVKLTEGFNLHLLRSKTKGFADLAVSGRDKLLWDGRNYEWHEGQSR